jgi:hypothetical protein
MNASSLRMNGWYSFTTGRCYEKKDRIAFDSDGCCFISGSLSDELYPGCSGGGLSRHPLLLN